MKRLQNYQKSICGFKRRLYTVIKNQKTNNYCYYLNAFITDNEGDVMIWKSSEKSLLLNKYTLPAFGFIYSLYTFTIKWPFAIIIAPLYMYFDGCKNFVRNRAWQNNVRFFNWVNIIIIVVLLLIVIS